MLKDAYEEDKTYEEMLAEALMQIPLYSEEWTNHNPSDPGITILENLTAFEALQQSRIHEVTPAVVRMLLKLTGFEARKGRCARMLLSAGGIRGEEVLLPANQQFWLGDLCYETNRGIRLFPCHLTGAYQVRQGRMQDISYLLDREVRVPACVFGQEPKAGDCLYLAADALPPPGEELIFRVRVADRHGRNPFGERGDSTFAQLRWECHTGQGFVRMHVRDETGGLLVSGEVRMRLPEAPALACPEAPEGMYAIRAVLERADYDVAPKLVQIDGFLFEVWQKETLSACYTFNRVVSASLPRRLLGDGYVTVFCKEEKGASYRKYEPCHIPGKKGRFFETREDGEGLVTWFFDRRRFGYGPAKVKNAIKIVVYQESMMRQYALGAVLGYDHQTIRLPMGNLVPESFCVIAERKDERGEPIYDFVRPGRYGDKDLSYDLYEDQQDIPGASRKPPLPDMLFQPFPVLGLDLQIVVHHDGLPVQMEAPESCIFFKQLHGLVDQIHQLYPVLLKRHVPFSVPVRMGNDMYYCLHTLSPSDKPRALPTAFFVPHMLPFFLHPIKPENVLWAVPAKHLHALTINTWLPAKPYFLIITLFFQSNKISSTVTKVYPSSSSSSIACRAAVTEVS